MRSKAQILLFILCFSHPGYLHAREAVNPHWTGIHCTECHLSEQGRELRLGGDHIALCNRCHGVDGVSADPHPVAVQLQTPMQSTIPAAWPLQNNKITCLTCHEPLMQMHENPLSQLMNPHFLRSAYTASPGDFCFTCHQKKDYRKANPHQQLDTAGMIIEESCLTCHRSVPDEDQAYESITGALKGGAGRICLSCHGRKDTNHPVRGNHLVPVPDTMHEQLRDTTTHQGVYLPLVNSGISCTTCHNPHQRGVLKGRGGVSGKDEAYFLRLKRGKELCTRCHQDIAVPDEPRGGYRKQAVVSTRSEDTIPHRPYSEEKCKACHAIEGYTGENPQTHFLCFREGCHETTLIKGTYRHEPSVLSRCTFCHNPHSAGYEKLLFTDEDNLCSTCHPLLRDSNGSPLRASQHETLVSYAVNNLALPPGYECHFCHNPDHKRDLELISTELCGRCHLHLRQIVSSHGHQHYAGQACSACHNPHASPYEYQLREPPEKWSYSAD